MSLTARLRGILFTLLLVTTALVGSTLLLPPAILIPLGFKKLYAKHASVIAWWWFSCAAAAIEVIGNVKYEIAGNDVPDDEKVLVICNHHCRLDWLYLWPLVMRHGKCASLHVTLKDSLRSAPFFGWAMQAFGFAFVSRRDRAGDLDVIQSSLAGRTPLWALLFPEGTDLSESNVAKSQKHGATLSPPIKWSHVLVPRAAGFAAAVEAMGPDLDAIYDVTVQYCSLSRPNEADMLAGQFPWRVIIRVDRVVRPPRDVKRWLFERWALKEKRLARGVGTTAPPSWNDEGREWHDGGRSLWAVAHVALGAFIGAAACYALCVDWRVRRVFYATSALWVGVGKAGGLDAFLLSAG